MQWLNAVVNGGVNQMAGPGGLRRTPRVARVRASTLTFIPVDIPPPARPSNPVMGLLTAGCRRLAGALTLALLLPAALALVLLLPAEVWAEFSGVDYTLTNQNEADFHDQDLANTSFAGAAGRHANFAGANLHGAILTQAAFPGASFHAADLSGVLMDKVDFSGADFTDAVLTGAIASGSNFSGATVTNADFSEALIDRADQRQLCQEAEGTNPRTGADTRLSLDC